MTDAPLVVGVELGGTKCIVTLGHGRNVIDQARFATTTPHKTIPQLIEQLNTWRSAVSFEAIGVASFGPLFFDDATGKFTGIAATPKPAWSHTALVGPLEEHFQLPVVLGTDVVGAAIAEWRWGTFAGARSLVYLTIGTGIGGAIIVEGRPVEASSHPEMGHVRVRRRPGDDFTGACPFHGDCIEGLAAGPAIEMRTGTPAASLGADHAVWDAVAEDLAELTTTIFLTTAPEHILIGGGVGLSSSFPLEHLRRATVDKLAGYVSRIDVGNVDRTIAQASLGELAGPLGSIALAERTLVNAHGKIGGQQAERS